MTAKTSFNILIVTTLAIAVCAVLVLKNREDATAPVSAAIEQPLPTKRTESQSDDKQLPTLVDLGAGTCIPCKKMAPILERMQHDYEGIVDIDFIDVRKDPAAGKPYFYRVIPTQIFFNEAGMEVFRHEGFFSRTEIEKVFSETLGVETVPDSGAGAPADSSEGEGAPAGLKGFM